MNVLQFHAAYICSKYMSSSYLSPFWAQNLLYISVTGARSDERMQDKQSFLPVAGLESSMFLLAGYVLLFFLLIYDCLFVCACGIM